MPTLDELKSAKNIVDLLEDDSDGKQLLSKIGMEAVQGYMIDEDSRSEWKRVVDDAMKIAKQTIESKDHPWPGASNIKYPLITDAAIDYASRTLPEIIQNERVVKGATAGADPKSEKFARAERVAKCMSYQLIVDSPDWEDGLDKLLQILPVLGTVFKKTYYNSLEKRSVSELCVPDKIVVNYNTQSLESARRISHILTMYANDVVERQRKGLFCEDVDVESLRDNKDAQNDVDAPMEFIEQHCWLDLDDDGYKEPYIVTVHLQSKQVLRIFNRFKNIEFTSDSKVASIEPIQYFTDFHFIRSPDGGFYSQGFGSLLLPINSAINTLINQLIDSGTLSNTQGGFLGRSLRIKNGEFRVKMGEWKVLDAASGTDIKQNVYPLPVREPSQTLFSLLSLLIQVGKDLSSTSDAMQGNQPAQNVATGTMNQLIEQGTKVFTAINKRLYRSLKKEYNKLYELNSKHLSQKEYSNILDDDAADVKKDFEMGSMDVHPVADPNMSSTSQRLNKVQLMQELKTVDPRAMDTYILQTLQLEQSQIDLLLPKPDPNAPPSPEVQKVISETKLNEVTAQSVQQKSILDAAAAQLSAQDFSLKAKESDAQIQEGMARVWKMQKDAAHNDAKVGLVAVKLQKQEGLKEVQTAHQIHIDNVNSQIKAGAEANKAANAQADQVLQAADIKAKIDISKNKEAPND